MCALDIYSFKTNKSQSLFGHKSYVSCVAFSPNNKYIVTGSPDY